MYQPAREFISSFKEGQIIRPMEFARSFTPEMSEGDKARQLCLFHEIADKELLRFNAFEFYKPLTSETEFVKKTEKEYNKFRGGYTDCVSYKYYVEHWVKNVPEDCFFTEDDIYYFIPGTKPAASTIRHYLNKAANEGKLLKYNTDRGRYYFKGSRCENHYNEIQQLFIDFLKKGKAFDKFVENLSKTCGFEDSANPLESMLTAKIHTSNWVSEAFNWSETPEGFEFWKTIHNIWLIALIEHFRPEIGTILKKLINSELKSYFNCNLKDMAGDLLFKEGWDLTKCSALI